MKIYTKTGDKGETSLVYGMRVAKNDPRVEAYGTCDEANAMLGLVMSQLHHYDNKDIEKVRLFLENIQACLFHVGSELSTPEGKEVYWKLNENMVKELEEEIDKYENYLAQLQTFILPGGSIPGATLHVVRTIVRRAERHATGLTVSSLVHTYLNRLSDYLFVAARYVNSIVGIVEKPYNPL